MGNSYEYDGVGAKSAGMRTAHLRWWPVAGSVADVSFVYYRRLPAWVKRINATLAGWVNYFRVGNSSRAFSEVRDYVEMKIRSLLTRRKRRRKSSIGWRRWSNEYLYDVLGLFWDWKIRPLPGVGGWK